MQVDHSGDTDERVPGHDLLGFLCLVVVVVVFLVLDVLILGRSQHSIENER